MAANQTAATGESLTGSQLERLIPLTRAAERLRGRGGRPPHPDTVRGWTKEGAVLRDGSRVVLQSVVMSGCLLFLPEWLETFERARSAAGKRVPVSYEPARSRRATSKATNAFLDRCGVKG